MKAVVKTSPEPGIEVVDRPYPMLKPGWVILKIRAAGICGSDIHTYHSTWKPFSADWATGGFTELALGHEFSGEVVEVGKGVDEWEVGDRVVASKVIPCGHCIYCRLDLPWCSSRVSTEGAMAEYLAMPSQALFEIPEWVSFEAAALCEPFTIALYAVQDVSALRPGQAAVILGPGPIGLLTLLSAKLLTPKVTVVTGRSVDVQPRLELAERLGADETINVDETDPVERVFTLTEGVGADVVYECAGVPLLRQGLRMLRYGGDYVAIGHPGSPTPKPLAFDSGDYYIMQSKRQRILSSFLQELRTWKTVTNLLWSKRVDLQNLVSHRIALTDAVRGFEIAASRKALKVVLMP
jgi:L-iditol 2-dehydrogenase